MVAPMRAMKLLHPLTLALTLTLALGCSSNGTQPNGEEVLCKMHSVASQACTEDCTWTEVLNHDGYCSACAQPESNNVAAVGDCGGYHILARHGVDTGRVNYYDVDTGALVSTFAWGGGGCDNYAPLAGCAYSDLKPLSSWCRRFAVDGSGTACCYGPANLPHWTEDAALICSWHQSDVQTGSCGDYRLQVVSNGDGSANSISYSDLSSGTLLAVVYTRGDDTACVAGPAAGFATPTCTPSLAPACVDGGATTN
jgi:hypothetical protein